LNTGIDGNGDGRVNLKNSVPDAIMTTAHMLQKLGWKKNQPWLEEASFVRNNLPWQETNPANRKSRAEWAKHGVTVMHAPVDSSPGTDWRLRKHRCFCLWGTKGQPFLLIPILMC